MSDLDRTQATITAAIAAAREVFEHPGETDPTTLRLKLADIACTLTNINIALCEAKERLASQERDILRLQQAFGRHEATVEYHGLRYRRTSEGKPCGKPFCQRCDEVEARLILIQQAGDDCSEVFCPNCRTHYPHVQTFLEGDEIETGRRAA